MSEPLAGLLGGPIDAAVLARDLERFEQERSRRGVADWPRYYADRIVSGLPTLKRRT